jgi:choline dehydrogenase
MFDYIIVGAGSSGCACAARLLNLLPNTKIALIESGDDYLAPADPSCSPKEVSTDFSNAEHFPKTWDGPANKGYRTVPQPALNDRQISIVRASAVGGCSVVNAMIWMRGFQEDWDEFMPVGFKGRDVEREFEWLEERIKPVTYEGNCLGRKGVEGAESLGYMKAIDSLWESPGTSTKMRIALDQEGCRQDMYRALGADDSRITLIKGMAERLIIEESNEGTKYASGVVLRSEDGSLKFIHIKDEGEVIVSCGAIDSPKLLQLSGIGPKRLIEELEIPLVLDAPAVGEGLRDHVMYILAFETPTLPEKCSPNGINARLYDEFLDVQMLFLDGNITPSHLHYALIEPFREKIPSTNMFERAGDAIARVGVNFLSLTLQTMSAFIPSFRAKLQSSVAIMINLMKPSSVGRVMIRSKDPKDTPIIDTAYLSKESDMDTLIKATKKAREILNTSPLSEIVGKQLVPPVQEGDDERVNIRKTCMPYHHATGTCSSCLDEKLRFKGIARLRVADASSLPFLPRAPTNASSMAVGARCASFIAAEKIV